MFKTLKLNRETLRTLQTPESLEAVQGAGVAGPLKTSGSCMKSCIFTPAGCGGSKACTVSQ